MSLCVELSALLHLCFQIILVFRNLPNQQNKVWRVSDRSEGQYLLW